MILHPTCVIVDPDTLSATAVASSLQQSRCAGKVILTGTHHQAAQILAAGQVDLLILPGEQWNALLIESGYLPRPPGAVVFLYGASAGCPFDQPDAVDFTLSVPPRDTDWRRIVRRYRDPTFRARSRDFMLLQSNCRMHVIYFHELERVTSDKGWLTVHTSRATYGLAGRASAFQRACPVPLYKISRSEWVTEPFKERLSRAIPI